MTTKTQFKLHVALIQNMEQCTAQVAAFRAWLEGPKGLNKRLGKEELPLDEPISRELPSVEEKQTGGKTTRTK